MSVVRAVQRSSLSAAAAEPAALTPFCFMWAAAHLLDLFCFPEWVREPTGIALFLTAVGVLLKPSASWRVLLMCVSGLAYLYVQSPITPNHILFEGFVNLTILLLAARHGRERLDTARTAVFNEAVPVLRGLLLTLYFFAFLHKLNWDFLTPATSCAGFMLDGIAEQLPFVPVGGPMKTAAVWITLLVEGGIPLLLVFGRTRRLAILTAWLFHFALAFHPRPGIYAFSAMILALMTLFLPPEFYATLSGHSIVRRIASVTVHRGKDRLHLLLIGVGGFAVLGAVLLLEGIDTSGLGLTEWVRFAGFVVWVPYSMALLIALWIGWPAASRQLRSGFLSDALRSPAVAVLLLFVLNCMAPYLGLQTVRTLSMFSNLRTEGHRTNHLFIPSRLQIADFQNDLIRPLASSDAWLDFYADNESLLPFTELRRRAWANQDVRVRVTYERAGRIETLDTSEPDAERRVPPLPFPLHKILAFREVDQDHRPLRCLW